MMQEEQARYVLSALRTATILRFTIINRLNMKRLPRPGGQGRCQIGNRSVELATLEVIGEHGSVVLGPDQLSLHALAVNGSCQNRAAFALG